MEQKNIIRLFIILFAYLGLAHSGQVLATIRRNSRSTDNITFSEYLFKEFYKCLCDGRYITCSAWYNRSKMVTQIGNSQEQYRNGHSCKYYKCQHNYSQSWNRLQCIQQSTPFCNSSDRKQTVHNMYSSFCVMFLWSYNDRINYSQVSSYTTCEETCECLTAARSTTSTAMLTQRTQPTTRNTRTTPTARTNTTTAISLAVSSTTENGNVQLTLTSETNSTSSKGASISDDNADSDNTPVIIGVVVSLAVVLVIAVVVVFIWRRRRSLQKKPADVNGYANAVIFPVIVKDGEIRTALVDSNQHSSVEYANCTFNKSLFENPSANNINGTTDRNGTERGSHSVSGFEYSKAAPIENRSRNKLPAVTDKQNNIHNTESRRFPFTFAHAFIENTLDETDDYPTSIYSVAAKTDFNSSNNDPSFTDGAVSSSLPQDQNDEHTYTIQTQGPDTRDVCLDHGYSKASKVPGFRGYQNVDLTVSSRLDKRAQNKNVAENSPADYYHLGTNSSAKPSLSSSKQASLPSDTQDTLHESTNASLPASGTTNTDVEYSIAGNVHAQHSTSSTLKDVHVYAKLGEEIRNVVNPYDVLLSDNDAQSSHQEHIRSVNHDKLTDNINPYSVANSIQG